jgi:hypothetical protein
VNAHSFLHTSEATCVLRLLRPRAQQIVPMIHRLGIDLILTPKTFRLVLTLAQRRGHVLATTHVLCKGCFCPKRKFTAFPYATVLQP